MLHGLRRKWLNKYVHIALFPLNGAPSVAPISRCDSSWEPSLSQTNRSRGESQQPERFHDLVSEKFGRWKKGFIIDTVFTDRSHSRVCCRSSSTASERQTDTWRGETVLNIFHTPRREKYVRFLQKVWERTGCKMNSQLFSQSRGLNRMIHWETCIKKY